MARAMIGPCRAATSATLVSLGESDSCFVVKVDVQRQALAYMYFEKELVARFRR